MKNLKFWLITGLSLLLIFTAVSVYQIQKAPVARKMPVQEKAEPVFSNQVLQTGAFGQDVYELQGRLEFLGFYHGKQDSHFGTSTRTAVMEFQKAFGMKADGVAGGQTKLKLYNATKHWRPKASSYNPNPDANAGAAASEGNAAQSATEKNSGGGKDASMASANSLGLTENDLKIMANAVNGEARGEPFEGQVAVAAVILNRVKSPSFPNTVSGVIFQPGAFTAVADGQIWLEPNESSKKAVRQALSGWDPTDGCIYYFNPETATSKWIWSRPQVKTIGAHIFCM
ncbi:spore cortex-lytic enzyme [Paenibacillus sp. CAA11]|uniref:spore cortex-lytic enzyme n=1 Tax=Paenibacillus sp. CAA11 TaxID=1532905 RepID=UPI000D37BACB|nr:spore cortex-lytic enzyme [Paenibacillus sp. CAA11]AWB44359.1 spore cortex-lytic enzyme [Paenibacillus sp. CAA11]